MTDFPEKHFLKKQIQEIQNSKILRFYGIFLGLTHVLTFFYWNQSSFFVNSQSPLNSDPLCYPFFPGCDFFQHLVPTAVWQVVLFSYLLISLFSIWCFLNKNQTKKAFFLLMSGTFIKLILYLSNYGFADDHHFMIHLVLLLYLFVPHKKTTIGYLIPAFYVAAGFSKINSDWLGATPLHIPWVSDSFPQAVPIYIIFLQAFLGPALLSAHRWLCWLILLELLAFHALSSLTVGFYDPLLMICLLSLFFMDEFFDFWPSVSGQGFNTKLFIRKLFKPKTKSHLKLFFNGKEKISVYICLFVFTFLQVVPSILVNHPHLSGVPQMFSLNLSWSKNRCKVLLMTHRKGESVHLAKPVVKKDHLNCNPIVYLNQAHQLCRKNQKFMEFKSLSLSLVAKRTGESQYKKILDIQDVCQLKNPLWAELFQNELHGELQEELQREEIL